MNEQEDTPSRDRALMLQGRMSALGEVLEVLDRLDDRRDRAKDVSPEWRGLHDWIEQAIGEAVAEVTVLKQEG